jgi:hypothetical protein
MLASRLPRWARERRVLLEAFVLSNLAFLTIDVYVAHAANDFHDPLEWIPVVFAAVGSAVLIAAFLRRASAVRRGPAALRLPRRLGFVVAWGAILVGVGGLFLHLEARFFVELTLESLVYSAPFVAPLAFAGLGLLLLVNRMVDAGSAEWGRWVTFLALGGFVGNFALSLADHAQNGFFFAREWISVVASAFAVAFLALAVFGRPHRRFFAWCHGVMAVQVAVGLLGFWYHLASRFRGGAAGGAGEGWAYELIFGAPVFAPLLFPDLALLAALGLWDLAAKSEAEVAPEGQATAA